MWFKIYSLGSVFSLISPKVNQKSINPGKNKCFVGRCDRPVFSAFSFIFAAFFGRFLI